MSAQAADRDRAAAERYSLPLISGSPVFNTAACHSVSTSRVAEQIKSHLRAWTGTIRRCVKLPNSKLNYFRRKYRAGSQHLTFSSFLATDPRSGVGTWAQISAPAASHGG
ncbi:hypothetical protein EYF80_032501 [Liparis tanakae]|uniref:Uncharacterized protein n=1 Tax=Liparis tanakae TaxID=230148 RepID=A0A4Z2GXD9_9TELE|nr:hypothetical protein EYF80_032501 [Liparis tanakae]